MLQMLEMQDVSYGNWVLLESNIVSRNGKAERLSVDHTPDEKSEFERLRAAKVTVENGRIGGNPSGY
jgi:hypothetical protein